MANNNKKDYAECYVAIGQFSIDKVTIGPVYKNTFTAVDGKTKINTFYSDIIYEGDKGEEASAFLELPETFSFGISRQYALGKPQIPENLKGYQMSYTMLSKDSVQNKTKTKNEKYTCGIFDSLRKKVADTFETDESISKKLPATARTFLDRKDGLTIKAVKPFYEYPKKVVGKDADGNEIKEQDTSKSPSAYVPLASRGKNILTKFFGPGGAEINPISLVNEDTKGSGYHAGRMHPILKLEKVYWGQHGQETPYGASIKGIFSEVNFAPQQDRVASRRMLAPSKEESDDVYSSGHREQTADAEDDDFDSEESKLERALEKKKASGKSVRDRDNKLAKKKSIKVEEEEQPEEEEIEAEEEEEVPKKASKKKTSAKKAPKKNKKVVEEDEEEAEEEDE